jgi:hypothetical protein
LRLPSRCAMSDDFDRVSRGGAQVGVGLATANPLKIGEGVATVLGVETNASAVQRLVAAEYEDFAFSEILRLGKDSIQHKAQLDTFEQRQQKLQWALEELERWNGDAGARASDLVATLEAGFKVWKSTADAGKRKLLGNALRNVFDPKLYEEGLTIRLLSLLESLTYGDIWVLRSLKDHQRLPRERGELLLTKRDLIPEDGVPVRGSDIPKGSLIEDHVKRLREHGLSYPNDRQVKLDGISQGRFEINNVSELGERLLRLVLDPPQESADPPEGASARAT